MLMSMMTIMLAVAGAMGNVATPLTATTDASIGKVLVTQDAVPQRMNLQGYVTDNLGNPVPDTSWQISVCIWRGVRLWEEPSACTTKGGIFSATLGATLPIPESIFMAGQPCSLQLTFDGQNFPKVEMTSTGYAYKSAKCDTATYALAAGGGGGGVTQVSQDTGITCVPNPITSTGSVKLNLSYSDGRYVNEAQANSVTSGMITDGTIVDADISASAAIAQSKIATSPRAIDADMLDGYHANSLPAPVHNHLGDTWTTSSVTRGLTMKMTASSADVTYGQYDSVSSSGAGDVWGGRFCVTQTGTGSSSYGLHGTARASAATDVYVSGVRGTAYMLGTGQATGGSFTADDSAGSGGAEGISGNAYVRQGSATSTGIFVQSRNYNDGMNRGAHFEAVKSTGTIGPSRGAEIKASTATTNSNYSAIGVDVDSRNSGNGATYGGYFLAAGTGGTGPRYAIYTELGSGGSPRYAGYFNGDVHVNGTLTKSSGSFLIDHPLDPLNKTLRHNFVESPENLCMYRGKVSLDAEGRATVNMPSYFVALTEEVEATAVLTPIGRPFATGYEWNGEFDRLTVYGDAGRDVSYLVLADRDDPVMRALRKPVEEEKGATGFKRGKLMQPEAYGYPESMGYGYENRIEHEQQKSTGSAQDEQ